jgi:hypothetical protein
MTSTPPSENSRHLMRLAQKLRTDRTYLASIIAAYQRQERLNETELANRLSMNIAQIPRLALCKRPFSESSKFAEQVRQIAAFVGADQTALAQLIRQVETLEQFHTLPGAGAADTEKQPLARSSGLLAAARDREKSDDTSISDALSDDNDNATT